MPSLEVGQLIEMKIRQNVVDEKPDGTVSYCPNRDRMAAKYYHFVFNGSEFAQAFKGEDGFARVKVLAVAFSQDSLKLGEVGAQPEGGFTNIYATAEIVETLDTAPSFP